MIEAVGVSLIAVMFAIIIIGALNAVAFGFIAFKIACVAASFLVLPILGLLIADIIKDGQKGKNKGWN